jgi:hypothetical protein
MSELQTTITTVTVYPDRARVNRSGTLKLEPGSHRRDLWWDCHRRERG